ncbi:hypothetical protein RY27_07975 [Litorilinea aerophila]|nr:hypothetical protein RY27_07975 [Litorilinea aerophila]
MKSVESTSPTREQDAAVTSSKRNPRPAEIAVRPAQSWNFRAILIGLMVPMGMTILNLSMFGVALPYVRDSFNAPADLMAWLVTAYTLPFVIFMPFYGRMGDGLGKRRLFLIGIVIFLIGTLICLWAPTLPVLMLGRVIQGIGTAGVNPLCIAIISDLFPARERGNALGTWSSTGPAISMIGPFLGGFLIERWGWHTIFIPGVLAAPIALYVVREQLPAMRPFRDPDFLRKFDWMGMFLLGSGVTSLVAYLSSRAITGVEPLQDWRMLLLTGAFFPALFFWERHHANPLATLDIFRIGNFTRASVGAALRMFTMSGISFLVPLYLADVHGLQATSTGIMVTLHAGALLTTVRLGGTLGDRWSRRWTMVLGMSTQITMMVVLGLLPATVPLPLIALALMAHGAGAGLSLAVLHSAAMDRIPAEQSGAAAGLYSMTRFFGNILGTTLGGVVLQQALAHSSQAVDGYRAGFLFIAGVGFLGILVAAGVQDPKR